ncbi:MAG: UDP-N-acetylmuramoyl-L-alanine--D-glutamate ligase [Kiritimatiellaeota bacterium]|nr:UDP-N-acetylmuramoyl-L-alanine--D-glutamate ligase [Kiritimatiellota bacterium]
MAWELKAGNRALVLGCGVSGVAGARLCHREGARVWVADEAPETGRVAETAAMLRGMGAVFCGASPFTQAGMPAPPFDLCVVSPGFGTAHKWVRECEARGIPVISELELGARYWKGKILAVTGSKGKSSLVKLCCDALNSAHFRAVTAGNYGTPLSARVLDEPYADWAVTEVSSFQMEHSPTFHPHIAILLNLQPDHLDRHASMEEYRALKMRMFANMDRRHIFRKKGGCMDVRELALFPAGLEVDPAILERTTCERFGGTPDCDWYYTPSAVRIKHYDEATPFMGHFSIAGSWFDNPVFGLAAAAGVAALLRAGLSAHAIEEAFKHFTPLPHRMEPVAEAGGVRWVDDSKATSFAAVAAALQMTPGRVRLIAGGRIKEKDVSFLKKGLQTRVEKVYLIGECAEFLSQSWDGVVACENCGDMAAAVRRASDDASPGETVLLSPGCASFDQFAGYHERGEVFKGLARLAAARRM